MSGYVFPTVTRVISDDFAAHVARGSVNPGTDYACGYGSSVESVAAGVVTDADGNPNGSGGRMVHVDNDDGTGADYLHLSALSVSRGDRVAQGQRLGYSGASGFGQNWYYGPHLHISFRRRHGAAYTNSGNLDFDALMHDAATASSDSTPLTPTQPRPKDEDMMIYSSTSENGRCYLVTPYEVSPVDNPNNAKQLSLVLTGSTEAPKVNGDQINIFRAETERARLQLGAHLTAKK
ncbi:M23 family metallopeptidase [Leifsonia aquatica]|uniref:M23 family metallopeptidase n=1 Tax=Leifsonia aquatica TaxID=144185 RepID=UPI0028A7F729|nr:M23 family metallopeptidase [Leifsonia aquatica]